MTAANTTNPNIGRRDLNSFLPNRRRGGMKTDEGLRIKEKCAASIHPLAVISFRGGTNIVFRGIDVIKKMVSTVEMP